MRLFLIPTAALVCCLSTGCTNDTSRARESARIFLSAMNRGDATEAQKVATLTARPHVATMLEDNKPTRGAFTLGTPVLKEDMAEVPMTLTSTNSDTKPTVGSVLLRREEKEWRVWALRVKMEGKPELTVDFEHPERMVGELLEAALGEFAKSLEGLSKTTEKSGRALGEALGGFLKGFSEGVEKTTPKASPPDDALTPPVVK
jgi:ribonucleotide monophosphatase NagD (HAD superfamily)